MSTRTCKGCGWVYPASQTGNKCRICGTPFDEVVCRVCGKLVSSTDRVPGRLLCKPCHNKEESVHMKTYLTKLNKGFDEKFQDWLALIAQVPKNYHPLTEQEWMRACRFFNGCAQCGNESIDARGFFIKFKDGGRYCDWNIIPLCSKCSADWGLSPNPFKAAWHRDNRARERARRDCLQRVEEYLGGILNERIAQNSGNDSD